MLLQWITTHDISLPSSAVMKLVKATEVIFKRQVISCDSGITMEKNIGLKIESALVEQFGPDIFNNVDNHFFDHHIGQERDHLTSLLRLVVKRYLNLRLKTYGKKYTQMIAHKNLPSSRHELTKTILFLTLSLLHFFCYLHLVLSCMDGGLIHLVIGKLSFRIKSFCFL